jgi:nucleoside-diphosphate-sugar epimerase
VTGSAGFVGRHMCAALESAGWDVQGIDLPEDARPFLAVCDCRYDLVVHAAAHVGGRVDIDGRPTFVGAYNLQLDGALFEWALRARPGAVVYLSSSAAYPVALQTGQPTRARSLVEADIDLAAPGLPDATYGWTKLTGERLAAEARAEGLRVHVVRPFSGYGTDQDNAYPFPAFIGRAQRRADPFRVWGDGRQVRDWIHIDDVCAAVLAVVDQGVDVPVNLCTGRPVSMTELAGMVASAAGYRPRVEPVGGPAGVLHRVGDPTLLRRFYEPKIRLEDGVRRALAG